MYKFEIKSRPIDIDAWVPYFFPYFLIQNKLKHRNGYKLYLLRCPDALKIFKRTRKFFQKHSGIVIHMTRFISKLFWTGKWDLKLSWALTSIFSINKTFLFFITMAVLQKLLYFIQKMFENFCKKMCWRKNLEIHEN